MLVKVWSDFVCPYCYRSEKDFQAIASNYGDDITLEVMSYELNPDNPKRSTHNAHRLYHYAKTENKGIVFYLAVQKAYFEEGLNIFDDQVLKAIAEKVGLHLQEVDSVLASNRFSEDVKCEHNAAEEAEIQYVPHFVFPSGSEIEGDLSPAQLREAIEMEL